jgi:tight adherence protein F
MNYFTLFCRHKAGVFLRRRKGAVAVEAAITFTAFISIIALIIDLGVTLTYQSRLERVTYTAASLLRERIALYGERIVNNRNQPLSQANVDQLQAIANQLMPNKNLVVVVEELQFQDASAPTTKIIENGYPKTLIASGENTGCKTNQPPLSNFMSMSPWSSRKRWLPLYRVTICMPGTESWFKRIANSVSTERTVEELIAFSIVIPR